MDGRRNEAAVAVGWNLSVFTFQLATKHAKEERKEKSIENKI